MIAFLLSRLAECCCFDLPRGTADPDWFAAWVLLLWVLIFAVLLLSARGQWDLAQKILKVSRLGGVFLLELLVLSPLPRLELLIGLPVALQVQLGVLLPVRAARSLQIAAGSLHQAA